MSCRGAVFSVRTRVAGVALVILGESLGADIQRKARLAKLEGVRETHGKWTGVHTEMEATTRPGGYGVRGMEGSNMHEGGLSSPIDSEVHNEMRWMSSSTSRMASPAVRTLIGRGAGVIPSDKHMLFVARCLVETQAALSFGGPYALIRWSSEGMKSAVLYVGMSCQDEGFAGAPAVKDWEAWIKRQEELGAPTRQWALCNP